MSHLAQYVIDILLFKEQSLSLVFYFCFIVMPVATMLIGRQAPQTGMKYTNYALKGLVGVAILGVFYLFIKIAGSGDPVEGSSEPVWDEAAIELSIKVALFAIYCGFGFIVGYSLLYLTENIKKAIPGLIGMAAFVLIIVISYQMADPSIDPKWLEGDSGVTVQDAKDASAGIIATLILVVIAVGMILAGNLMKFIRSF
jgi:hypothetical protein